MLYSRCHAWQEQVHRQRCKCVCDLVNVSTMCWSGREPHGRKRLCKWRIIEEKINVGKIACKDIGKRNEEWRGREEEEGGRGGGVSKVGHWVSAHRHVANETRR